MRSKFFLPFLLLFIFSCSEDEQVEDIVLESPSSGINWCVQQCSVDRRDCFDWASENRTYRLNDCDAIGTIVYDPKYCTRTVIIGYDDVPVYSPEGELIRVDRVPIYGQEQYVCGQTPRIVRTATEQQEYDACVQNAQDEFVDAVDNCDIKYIECQQKCDKPKPGDLPIDDGSDGDVAN